MHPIEGVEGRAARRLVVLAGTGTGIGKTHAAEALLLALGATGSSCCRTESGWESGGDDGASGPMRRGSGAHQRFT